MDENSLSTTPETPAAEPVEANAKNVADNVTTDNENTADAPTQAVSEETCVVAPAKTDTDPKAEVVETDVVEETNVQDAEQSEEPPLDEDKGESIDKSEIEQTTKEDSELEDYEETAEEESAEDSGSSSGGGGGGGSGGESLEEPEEVSAPSQTSDVSVSLAGEEQTDKANHRAESEVDTEKRTKKSSVSQLASDSRLAPVKKGQFFEHDNRDDSENESKDGTKVSQASQDVGSAETTENVAVESKQQQRNAKKSEGKGQKGANAATEAQGKDKWTHDLFEKQLGERTKGGKKAKQGQNGSGSAKPTKSENNRNNTTGKDIKAQSASGNKKVTGDIEADSLKKSSKGLSLTEYLEQSPNASPVDSLCTKTNGNSGRKQSTKPNGTANTNKAQSNKSDGLLKRLDFSTRQPISSDNFADNASAISNKNARDGKGNAPTSGHNNHEAKKFNLQITANLDTSKRTVNIDNKPHARGGTGGQAKVANNNTNSFVRYTADSNGNQATRVFASGMPKSNTVHFMADESGRGIHNKGAGNDSYDEYYFNEYEVGQQELGQQQRNLQPDRQNRRPFKDSQLGYVQTYIDPSNLHIYHSTGGGTDHLDLQYHGHSQRHQHHIQPHQRSSQPMRGHHPRNTDTLATTSYTEYIDYSGQQQAHATASKNDFAEYSTVILDQPASQMYPIHQQTFMSKSHSFTNGHQRVADQSAIFQHKNNSNRQNVPRARPQVPFEYSQQFSKANNKAQFNVYQASATASKPQGSRLRFDVDKVAFTPVFTPASALDAKAKADHQHQ